MRRGSMFEKAAAVLNILDVQKNIEFNLSENEGHQNSFRKKFQPHWWEVGGQSSIRSSIRKTKEPYCDCKSEIWFKILFKSQTRTYYFHVI